MDRKGKGKQIATGKGSSSAGKKRKNVEFRDEGLRINRRKKSEVLQFFEESAEVGYFGESSDDECDIDGFLNDMEEDLPEMETTGMDDKVKKGKSSFVFPKEEEINEEEYDRIMEERYKPGSGFVRYADDDVKNSIEMDRLVPTDKDPPIWKVKCAIGRERHSVFCLMHKFVERRKIGNKLQILSVFSVDHLKGFIFIEAEKEQYVLEACNGLNGIYATRMVLLPKAEAPHLLAVQRKTKKFSEGKWARVKSGKYKGDLAQVVAMSDTRGKALIKLIPRIDIQALTLKYSGGVAVQRGLPVQKGPPPAPRLISSSELEEFRPLIQVRRDRDTGITFEHLDSLMLKDGFLYKKVSLDSLSSWGIMPSKEEILKFTPVEHKETGDVEWISEIYGEEKKRGVLPTGRGGGKGEGSGGGKGESSRGGKGESSGGGKGESSGGGKGEGSESFSESSYELYNLICFSRRDFGLIVGVDDKGDGYKVLKESPDGPVVVTVAKKEMQNEPFDSKFTALDLHNKQISVNDVVKISKGPSEGKQGVVRQVYRGIIFIYVESEEENGGYFCCKSQECEKVKLFTEESNEKNGEFEASAFGDFGDSASSPKSPLSPEKEWQPREKYINSNQGDKGSMYSIGQKLRIRVGPWKGYLCRVIALRYSDITVKLDTQQKPFIFKSEHLAEVRDRNTMLSTSGDAGTGSFQPFDMLGTEGSSGDWAKGAGTSGEGGNWNTGTGGASTDWNSWGSKPTSDVPEQTVPDDNTSSWAAKAPAETNPASTGDQPGGWNSWGKPPATDASTVGAWGVEGSSKVEASSWGKQGGNADGNKQEDGSMWGKVVESSESGQKKEESSWGKKVEKQEEGSVWGKVADDSESSQKKEESSWGKKGGSESGGGGSSWGNKDGNASASKKEGVSWGQQDKGSEGSNGGGSAWGNQGGGFGGSGEKKDGSSGWGKPDGGSSWGKQEKGGSSGVETDGGSSWGKKDDGGSSWGKKDDGGSSWGKKDDGSKDDGGSSWGKKDDGNKDDGGSSWGKKDDGNKDDGGSSWGKKVVDGGSSWGKKDDGNKDDGGSSWGKKDDGNKDDGGSTWGKKADGGSSWAKKDDGGSSWGKKDDGGTSWGKKDDEGYSEQTFDRGGRGFGGRRGGGRRGGGRDNFGRGRSSFNNSEDSAPWSSKPGGGSSWGKQDADGGGGSKPWSEQSGGGSKPWSEQSGGGSKPWSEQSGGGGSSWGKQDSGTAWGKKDGDGGSGSTWGKQDGGGGGSTWGKQNDAGGGGGSSWSKQNDGGGSKPWSGGGGSSWSKQDDGGGSKPWSEQSGGGSKPWSEQSGGGSSWSKQDDGGGSKPWSEESGGSRGGFGGRRGGFRGGREGGFRGGREGGFRGGREGGFRGGREGGFRGGREGGFRGGREGGFRGGRGRGGYDRDQSSSWKSDNQENTTSWKSDNQGGGNTSLAWKSEQTSGGGGGNWSSWGGSNSKKEETNTGNDNKPINETKATAWGTSNESKAEAWGTSTSNENKNDASGSSGGGWGAKTDAGTSSTGGGAAGWGTGDKKSGW